MLFGTFTLMAVAFECNLLNRPNDNASGFLLGAADFGVISSARPCIGRLGATVAL